MLNALFSSIIGALVTLAVGVVFIIAVIYFVVALIAALIQPLLVLGAIIAALIITYKLIRHRMALRAQQVAEQE